LVYVYNFYLSKDYTVLFIRLFSYTQFLLQSVQLDRNVMLVICMTGDNSAGWHWLSYQTLYTISQVITVKGNTDLLYFIRLLDMTPSTLSKSCNV
jgi:hypothetical protein